MMQKQKKLKPYYFKKVIIFIVMLLAFLELIISHRLATEGEILREIETQTEKIEKENQILREGVAQGGSLNEIAEKAARLDLVRAGSNVVSFSSEIPVALKP